MFVGSFDGEAGVDDHPAVVGAGSSFAGEVVAQEDRVGEVQRQRLQTAQVDFAPARETYLDVREVEAEQCQDPKAAVGGEVPSVAQWGAVERYVDGRI